jgi:hypothetical protein
MTLAEVMPAIESLPRTDKFELIKFILSKLAQEEAAPSVSRRTESAEEKDALWEIVGMTEGEDAEVARHHDKYLYGA